MPRYATSPRFACGPKRARSIGAPSGSINSGGGLRARRSIQLDLHVHARGKLELHEGVHRLVGGIDDVHESLVGAQLELITRVLVGMRRDEHGEALHLGRQRHRPLDGRAGALGRLHDLARRAVDQAMIERLQADTDVLVCHTKPPQEIELATPNERSPYGKMLDFLGTPVKKKKYTYH